MSIGSKQATNSFKRGGSVRSRRRFNTGGTLRGERNRPRHSHQHVHPHTAAQHGIGPSWCVQSGNFCSWNDMCCSGYCEPWTQTCN